MSLEKLIEKAHGIARIVLLPTPCHMPPREKARHSKSSSRSSPRHPAPQPSVLVLEGNSACMFEVSAAPPNVSLIILQMTFACAMQRQRLYSNEPSVSEGGKPCQPMSRLRWVKLMHNFDLHCQPVRADASVITFAEQIPPGFGVGAEVASAL